MSTTAIFVVIVVAIAALVLLKGKKSKKPKPLPDVTQGKTGWRAENSTGVVVTPEGTGCSFNVPATGGAHAVVNWNPPKLTLGGELHLSGSITGGGFTPQEYPDKQAIFAAFLQRKGDDLTAEGEKESYRWYSRWFVPLVAGVFDVKIPLVVEHWGNVRNQQDAAGFAACLADLANAGVTLGHDSGRAHGVFAVDQPARIDLIEIA